MNKLFLSVIISLSAILCLPALSSDDLPDPSKKIPSLTQICCQKLFDLAEEEADRGSDETAKEIRNSGRLLFDTQELILSGPYRPFDDQRNFNFTLAKYITYINLSYCDLGYHLSNTPQLLAPLHNSPFLKTLDVSHNGLQAHVSALMPLTGLTELNISSNSLGDEILQLTFLTNLTSLIARDNMINPGDETRYEGAFKDMTKLTSIDISNTSTFDIIAEIFKIEGHATVTVLDYGDLLN